MAEIKYLDLEGLKYFKKKQDAQQNNKQYIAKTGEIFEEYAPGAINTNIPFVLTIDDITGIGTIKAVDLATHKVPMAKEADTAKEAEKANTATKAESAKNATNADNANNATTAESLLNSVKIYGQDFQGIDPVDGALTISNERAINPGGNLYNCSTPFILNSTQTTSKDSSGSTRTSGIGYVGAKLTTTRENKINNTTTVTGYGVYTDGDILYMWHQNNNNLYSNEDPGNASQILSIVKDSSGITANFNFNKLYAGNTTTTFGETTVTGLHITSAVNMWWDSNNSQIVISGGPIKNKAIDLLDSRITALESGSTGGSTKTWVGTQSQYDQITVKDGDTFYYITEN